MTDQEIGGLQMTPERQMWWDNLPAEEKQVRQAIKRVKCDISFAKFVIKNSNMNIISRWHYRKVISHQKILLKALRKQIAMRPVIKKSLKCLDTVQLAIAYLMCQKQDRFVINAGRNLGGKAVLKL